MKKQFILILFAMLLLGAERIFSQGIAAGQYHSLFRCSNGVVMSCGYNIYGQLGIGQFDSIAPHVFPEQVLNLTGIISVAAYAHSLFLKNDGTVWACGYNGDNYQYGGGQLGDGTDTSRNSPFQINGLSGIIALSAGYSHSLFLKNDGTVWACGYNSYGELGDGTYTERKTPIQVSGLSGITAIAAGEDHSLFLKNDGTVWACGFNGYGQLGNGTNTNSNIPVQVNLLSGINALGAGTYYSLFLKNDGTVWGCGKNSAGQLGDGTNLSRNIPMQTNGLIGITSVATGYGHSLFLKNDGTVWACGYNGDGQLGDGTSINRNIPVQVNGLSGITALGAGFYHSLFLKNNGTVWACGYNLYGQLGDGTTAARNLPVQVQNLCKVSLPERNYPNYIKGFLYDDANKNCSKENNEKGFPFIAISATPGNFYAFTNDSGQYSLGVNDSVNYSIQPIIPQRFSYMLKNPCPPNYSVYLDSTSPPDTTGFDFGMVANLCHQLRVAIGESRKRRCARDYMSVTYWNEGLATANNVEVRLKFSQYDIPLSASLPFTWNASDSSLVFNIGTLLPNQRGKIDIVDSIACISGITGLTQCTKAWILPPNQCYLDSTTGAGWDKSSLKVSGGCVNDTVRFVIYNHGSGNMAAASQYRIYADNILQQTVPFQLNSGDSLVIWIVSGGATIRLEADQNPGHPGNSHPRATVEACGTNGSGNFSTGMVNQVPQDDNDVDVAIDCLPIRDSFDPNEKANSPSGIGANKIVLPNTPVDFIIRFQNTGTDTAYKVVIRDTLSSDYDLSTLELGAASGNYIADISGEGKPILKFTFNNIMLVDSFTNESLSHGFVKYKITPKTSVALGTKISNSAAIYFDFNDPVITNDAFITLGNYLVNGLKQMETKKFSIKLFPNPAHEYFTIDFSNLTGFQNLSGLEFRLFNVLGQKVRDLTLNPSPKGEGLRFQVDCHNLPGGIYFYKITDEKKEMVGNGKIVID